MDGVVLENICVVKEFPNIILKELSGLPPKLEVEFKIELLFGIAPVSIAPYYKKPKELKELKVQLQEFLYLGFIWPSG